MNIKDKMLSGELYLPFDEELMKEQQKRMELIYDYNSTRPSESKKREELLREMFAEIGDGCYIEPPFYANWAGAQVHLGKNVYSNFNLTLVDDAPIYIGDYTMIAPNVTMATASHPILPSLREKGYQYNLPIHIGKNCWIGAGVIILSGVNIGDNSVIGAGSVVIHDIPENSVAVGVPCRVIRKINDNDREFYRGNRRIPDELK